MNTKEKVMSRTPEKAAKRQIKAKKTSLVSGISAIILLVYSFLFSKEIVNIPPEVAAEWIEKGLDVAAKANEYIQQHKADNLTEQLSGVLLLIISWISSQYGLTQSEKVE